MREAVRSTDADMTQGSTAARSDVMLRKCTYNKVLLTNVFRRDRKTRRAAPHFPRV